MPWLSGASAGLLEKHVLLRKNSAVDVRNVYSAWGEYARKRARIWLRLGSA